MLALLAMLSPAMAASDIFDFIVLGDSEIIDDMEDLLWSEKFSGTTFDMADGDSIIISNVGMNEVRVGAVYAVILAKDGLGNNDTELDIECWPSSPYSINISESLGGRYWESNGYAIHTFAIRDRNPEVDEDRAEERPLWVSTCEIGIDGEDVLIGYYIVPRLYPDLNFPSPNPSLEGIVGQDEHSGVRDILNAGFDIFFILIIITQVVLFSIVIVFIWKMFEFFASRLRIRPR